MKPHEHAVLDQLSGLIRHLRYTTSSRSATANLVTVLDVIRTLNETGAHDLRRYRFEGGELSVACDVAEHVSAMINIMKELSDARVEELELQVASLHDLVADGVFDEYGSFECWRCVAAARSKTKDVGCSAGW